MGVGGTVYKKLILLIAIFLICDEKEKLWGLKTLKTKPFGFLPFIRYSYHIGGSRMGGLWQT